MTALHPYRVKCAGLECIALATGAAQAIADAIALHSARGASAKPINYVYTSGRADFLRLTHPQQRFYVVDAPALKGGAA